MRAREANPSARARRERGASLVEFALIAPLLLLLIFGVFEFGRLLATHVALNTAAREGARFGTTIGDRDGNGTANFIDCDEIRDVARQRAVMVTLDDADIDIFYDNGEGSAVYADCQGGPLPEDDVVATGDRITVVISRPFSSSVPLIGPFLNGINFRAEQSRTIFRTIVDE